MYHVSPVHIQRRLFIPERIVMHFQHKAKFVLQCNTNVLYILNIVDAVLLVLSFIVYLSVLI